MKFCCTLQSWILKNYATEIKPTRSEQIHDSTIVWNNSNSLEITVFILKIFLHCFCSHFLYMNCFSLLTSEGFSIFHFSMIILKFISDRSFGVRVFYSLYWVLDGPLAFVSQFSDHFLPSAKSVFWSTAHISPSVWGSTRLSGLCFTCLLFSSLLLFSMCFCIS
jgi:hypothetical protein